MTLVRYLATPVVLFLELQESLDAFQREVQLSAIGNEKTLGDDVVDGMVVERHALVDLRMHLHDQAVAARDAGLECADLEVVFSEDAAARVTAITVASRHADEAAADGRLLTPPVRPEVRAVQTWMYEQVTSQLQGASPTPFPAAGGDG